ncbi:lipopolysaccharide assembly protein LapB [Acaryochloris marina]|uniref:tetratricopeptide repeat protein n=1 Tax=Acaryochloris marina TaxID=155978 RepID=UPI001BAF24AF|nr:tetratricopeptide repeat protein [Acaryochloris marina]QUY43698.1 tetratricopeptide repeat protein [Acaryochloris marina S15]
MNFTEQLRILKNAQGDPAALVLASVDIAYFTLTEPQRQSIKQALIAAAIPHWCDSDLLVALLDTTPDKGDILFDYLRKLTVIEPFPARGEKAMNVHESARLTLRDYLRKTDPARWVQLSTNAWNYLNEHTETHARIEALYHLFATDQIAAAAECELLTQEITHSMQPENTTALSLALEELANASWLKGAARVEALLATFEVRSLRGDTAQLEDQALQVMNLAHATSRQSGISRAQCLLGDIYQTKGRLDDALKAFNEYLSICQNLTSADPSNAKWQRDLGVAYARTGDIYQTKGRLDDALKAFNEYLSICQNLISADPSNAVWRRDLGVAYARTGDIYQTKGRLDDALKAFNEYLSICQNLISADPSNVKWQRDLGFAYVRTGDIYQTTGRLDDALKAFNEYLSIFQNLTSADPSNAKWQRDLGVAYSRTGDIYQTIGRLDDALKAFNEYLSIFQNLTSADPSNAVWQRELGVAYSRIGDIYQTQGRLDDALKAFNEDLSIFQNLTSADPSNAAWQRELAVAHARIGGIYKAL